MVENLGRPLIIAVGGLCLAVFITIIVVGVKFSQFSNDLDDLSKKLSERHVETVTSKGKLINMIGLRQDYRLQECQGSDFKQSFSDVDYALLGYNILRGYPLAVGHDPGFTFPIFKAEYLSGGQTADCRYSVPDGLVIIPDVSCETSFASKTINNVYEFAKTLKASAKAEGSGWGASFSASAGHNEVSSEISKGESVYIISTAKCQYYFSKIIPGAAPRFDDTFKHWLYKLNNTLSNSPTFTQNYIEFLDTYGTHFPTQITFGASYTFENKMSTNEYQKQTESGINVAAQASYSGLLSLGGGFELDDSQKEAASKFAKSVETKTITVGAAPPANGDAMTWASEVKTSPVPTSYSLSSIESLFTDKYMQRLNIDLKRISENIVKHKLRYCRFLLTSGQAESCKDLAIGITLRGTLFKHESETKLVASFTECIGMCLDDVRYIGISYHSFYKTCNLYTDALNSIVNTSQDQTNFFLPMYQVVEWQSNIFPDKIENTTTFEDTEIVGVPRGFDNDEDNKASLSRCEQLCKADASCVAFTHCEWWVVVQKCKLYSEGQIVGMAVNYGRTTVFLSRHFHLTT